MDQPELFEDNRHEDTGTSLNGPSGLAGLFELSAEAYYSALYAGMSELPIGREILRFIEKVEKAGSNSSGKPLSDRAAAARAAFDRGDPNVLAVLKAAGKVTHEIHRMSGFLRFSPGADGVYTARCAPDHFILPALAGHFYFRFGEMPWAIIDEKRNLCLYRKDSGPVQLIPVTVPDPTRTPSIVPGLPEEGPKDFWEDLWRLYHRSVNNEEKKNPHLQRQFMPERYHKYLPELNRENG